MTSVLQNVAAPPGISPRPPAIRTLAQEHRTLLRDVRRRTTPILTLIDAHTWPAAELDTLTAFLRAAVLRQISDEDRLLFPADQAAAAFGGLRADHLHLHTLTRQMEQVSVTPCSLPALATLIDEFLATFQRHLEEERAVLAIQPGAPHDPPGTAELANESAHWPLEPGDTVIVLDALRIEQMVRLSIERLLRMRPGESAEVRSSNPDLLRPVWDWMRCYDTVGYGFSRTSSGPQQWAIRITRRDAALAP